MMSTKTIAEVFNESKLSKDKYDLYLSYLESTLLSSDFEINSPWFSKIITMIGAWFGSLLFLAFLFFIRILNSGESMIITGCVFIFVAIGISYANVRDHFIDSLSLSLSILGLILFMLGIGNITNTIQSACFAGLFVEILIYISAQSYIHKFLSVILIPACLLGTIWNSPIFDATQFIIGGLAVASVLIWTNELPLQIWLKKKPYFYIPTAYGVVLGLLLLLILSINNKFFVVHITHWYFTFLIAFLSLVYLLYNSLYISLGLSKKYFIIVISIAALLFLPTVQAPGIISSALIIILGFAKSNRVLLTLGIIFLATFIISFYYSLQLTLLIKSLILIITGILFLGMGFALGQLKKKVSTQ